MALRESLKWCWRHSTESWAGSWKRDHISTTLRKRREFQKPHQKLKAFPQRLHPPASLYLLKVLKQPPPPTLPPPCNQCHQSETKRWTMWAHGVHFSFKPPRVTNYQRDSMRYWKGHLNIFWVLSQAGGIAQQVFLRRITIWAWYP